MSKKLTDEELSKGTFSCPICGLDRPHSKDAHTVSVLPDTIYGIPSTQKDFLVWIGSDKHKALALADFGRNIIEYRRVDTSSEQKACIERMARSAEELGDYDKFIPSDES